MTIRAIVFDWGDTLMRDFGLPGPMALWPRVEVLPGAAAALEVLHERYRLAVASNAGESGADLIRQGALGTPYYAEAEYVADIGWLTALTPWRKHFAPIRYCTHSLGPVLRWIGQELREVACFSTGPQHGGDPGLERSVVPRPPGRRGRPVRIVESQTASGQAQARPL